MDGGPLVHPNILESPTTLDPKPPYCHSNALPVKDLVVSLDPKIDLNILWSLL